MRGGYLAAQSSWILFMSETGNNRTDVLIKYLCHVSESVSGIGDPRSLPVSITFPKTAQYCDSSDLIEIYCQDEKTLQSLVSLMWGC